MKALVKSIAAMAATSAIAVCALVTAVSASTKRFDSSVLSAESMDWSVPFYFKAETYDILTFSDDTGDINCRNSDGRELSYNTISNGLYSKMEAKGDYITNYKWCSILLKDNSDTREKYAVSNFMDGYPNQKVVDVLNPGFDGLTVGYATYVFCVNDGPNNTNSVLGKTYLDLSLVSNG